MSLFSQISQNLRQPLANQKHRSLIEIFFASCKTYPDQAAILDGKTKITYRELDELTKNIAANLGSSIKSEFDIIAIEGEKNWRTICLILAILCLGATFLLIDKNLPELRKKQIEQEVAIKLTIRNTPEIFTRLAKNPASPTTFKARSSHYIFFTSGSTGIPKAILKNADGIAHFVLWEAAELEISRNDVVANLTSLSFDVILRDYFLPLSRGACIAIPPADLINQPHKLFHWFEEIKVSILHTVPSITRYWLNQLKIGQYRAPYLRAVLFAGEVLNYSLIKKWQHSVSSSNTKYYNLYGPTETTLAKFYHSIDSRIDHGIVPVGKPIPNTAAYCVKDHTNPADDGEIYIRTHYASSGYLGSHQHLNKKLFIHNPFSQDLTDTLYKTGDLGYYNEDGLLVVTGRKDNQIKINGIRIQPEEINQKILALESVLDSYTLAKDNSEGQKSLTAYVVTNNNLHIDQEIMEHLIKYFNGPMLPSEIIYLVEIPKLPNGKPDKNQLYFCNKNETLTSKTHEKIIKKLEDSLKLILNINSVDTTCNFFDLGLSSLSISNWLTKINKIFRTEITILDIYTHSNLLKLAELIKIKEPTYESCN